MYPPISHHFSSDLWSTHRQAICRIVLQTAFLILLLTSGTVFAVESPRTATIMQQMITESKKSLIISVSAYFYDDENRKSVLDVWLLDPQKLKHKIGLFIQGAQICRDETSVLYLRFSDGQIHSYPSSSSNKCDTITMFVIDATTFPTHDITSLQIVYNQNNKFVDSLLLKRNMQKGFSDFLQLAITESYLITEGRLNPMKAPLSR